MNLSEQGRQALDLHFVNTARAFGVQPGNPSAGQHYAATPSVAQTIYNKVVEDGNQFLRLINGAVMVGEIKGEKVGMDLTGRVASRTDTSGAGERTPKHLLNTDAKGYELFPTQFDVALKYSKIDSWAKFPDFAERYIRLVRQAMGNDMLTVGWHGTSAAGTTNLGSNPNLEDLNIGWLQILRDFNSGSQHYAASASELVLGTGDAKNLDVLVHEAKMMLPVYHRNRDDLVALVSGDLLSAQEETYYEVNGNTPTEKAMLSGRITRAYGGLPAITPPFFPDGIVKVTPLSNLSIYIQDSSIRRTQKDKPEKDEVQDFNSANQGYVVEDEEMAAFIEGIELPPAA